MFGRAMMLAGGDIAADHGADRFEPLPAHVAVMGVRHQRQPLRPGLAANLHAASSAVSRRDSRSTIGISAAINGDLDHPVDGGIGRPTPGHIPIRLLHGQIEIMLMEPKQRLARAAQRLDLVKDERDALLPPPVRILLVTVAVLHEANGRGDDQFPAARLLVSGRQRALAEKIELVLVEAPLEPEEESVVPVPGRIHRLLINQHRVDHAAHLDELLPIPAVAGETRDFAGANGADLAEADLRNHPLEASALHAAGGGATEILVDDLNLRPAEHRQATAHGVLQSAALTVVQNLMPRGLAHVEQRLALQMVGTDLLRGHHRPPSTGPHRLGARNPGSGAPSGRSGGRVPPPATRARSAPSSRCLRRTDRSGAASRRSPAVAAYPAGWVRVTLVPSAWCSPRFRSRRECAAPKPGGCGDAGDGRPTASKRRDNADSAAMLTKGSATMQNPAHAARSNIHAGSSCQRAPSAPFNVQRK